MYLKVGTTTKKKQFSRCFEKAASVPQGSEFSLWIFFLLPALYCAPYGRLLPMFLPFWTFPFPKGAGLAFCLLSHLLDLCSLNFNGRKNYSFKMQILIQRPVILHFQEVPTRYGRWFMRLWKGGMRTWKSPAGRVFHPRGPSSPSSPPASLSPPALLQAWADVRWLLFKASFPGTVWVKVWLQERGSTSPHDRDGCPGPLLLPGGAPVTRQGHLSAHRHPTSYLPQCFLMLLVSPHGPWGFSRANREKEMVGLLCMAKPRKPQVQGLGRCSSGFYYFLLNLIFLNTSFLLTQ